MFVHIRNGDEMGLIADSVIHIQFGESVFELYIQKIFQKRNQRNALSQCLLTYDV